MYIRQEAKPHTKDELVAAIIAQCRKYIRHLRKVVHQRSLDLKGVQLVCDCCIIYLLSPSPEKLSLNLLRVLFTTNELATSNCTQPWKAGIKLLGQRKIHGIRCELLNDVPSLGRSLYNQYLIRVNSKTTLYPRN